MTGIVLVSHSLLLAQAALDLAHQLVPAVRPRVEIAAGLPGGGLGTDATAIAAAVERTAGTEEDGSVLVLMDLGSALMSAEMALELIDPDVAARTRLSPAPLVEGLIGAYSAAGIGRDLDAVAGEAESAGPAKRDQLGL